MLVAEWEDVEALNRWGIWFAVWSHSQEIVASNDN